MKQHSTGRAARALPPVSEACQRVRLAESSVAAVDECDCGMMQLHLAAMTLRLTPDAVSELLATLGMAVARKAARSAQGVGAFPVSLSEPGHA